MHMPDIESKICSRSGKKNPIILPMKNNYLTYTLAVVHSDTMQDENESSNHILTQIIKTAGHKNTNNLFD